MPPRLPSLMSKLHGYLSRFILGVFAAIFIAACGINTQQQSSTSRQPSPSECQNIQHQLGEACIPTSPQRIIVTSEIILDTVLVLGLKPIAAAEPALVGSRSRHLAGKIDELVSLGNENQPSLEKILQLNPDLILGFNWSFEHNYEQFSQIAPTLPLGSYSHDGWNTSLQRLGEILNRSQQAQQQLDNYQARVEKLKTALGERLNNIEVSVVRFSASGVISLYLHGSSFPGSVLEDVGLPRPKVQQENINSDAVSQRISLERLDLLDGDIIFAVVDPGANEAFTKFQQEPLLQKLKAVQSDRVYIVDSGYWYTGNVLAANAILDDLFKYLVPEEE